MAYQVKISADGQIPIPAAVREARGVEPGDDVLIDSVDGQVTLRPVEQFVREFQKYFRALPPEAVREIDDFIAERRAEAAREDEKFDRISKAADR